MQKIVAACLLLLPTCLFAQRFGGTPPSIHWKQINTDSVRIIFPAGLDSQAQRIASVVHYQAANMPASLGNVLHKINIVLQNQTTIANGYVGLGPYRSEFYLNPSLNNFQLGSISWPDQLAIHEYRHVQQFNNFHNGLSNLMGILFGEEGYSVAVNASIPDWFYEGDAVYNETVLSKQGRGRLPLFMNAYPSLWKAGKKYSWMKLRNGSLKDYVPNHYNLGYLLVNYGREKYGVDFWTKVTKDASAFKGLFYPFQKAIKKYAGVDYETFRKEAFEYYKSNMPAIPKETDADPLFPVNKKVLTSYIFPYSMSSGYTVYQKNANNKRPAFYIRDSMGSQYPLRVRDISIDDQFSYRNSKIVYAAYESDARWSWRDYSVIKLLDVNTGKQRSITHKSKYFTPDISASGEKIAAIQLATNGKSELHILDAATGEVKNKIHSADISVFTDPKFITEDSLVCAVRLVDGKMALAIINLQSGSVVRLTPPSFNVAGFPSVSGNTIYFTASYGGNDDVFAVKLGDLAVYRVTNNSLGNYFVNAGDAKLTWSTFTAEGYQMQQIEQTSIELTAVPAAVISNTVLNNPVSDANNITPIVPGQLSQRNFPINKYSKGTRLLNFHSWRPYYEDPEFTFSIYGENVLNTLETQLYYLYNENDRTHAAGASLVYGGWFPYLSLGTQYTFNRQVTINANTPAAKTKQWDQLDTRVGLNVPLNWVSGRMNNGFNAGTNFVYRKDFNKGFYKDTFSTIQFSYLQHFISFTQQAEMATQHIFPRIGYSVSGEYRHAISNYKSWQSLTRGTLYLPGALPTHSLVVNGGWQETDTSNALFGNRLAYSRGYNAAYFSRMWRTSVNYHFPLFYPDWGFGNILYLQRIRANGFYDFMRVYSNNKINTADQRSVGGEIYFDTKWWNQYELSFGVRMSYLLDRDFYSGQSKVAIFEFILPVSIIPR
ncbi:MAG: hypothetical protein ABIR18_15185 [Chitinophagaceae bacterium]